MDFSDEPSGGQSNATKNPSGPPPPTSPLGVNSQQAPPAIQQQPQTNTSWAAAAGKGLPPVETPAPNGSNASSTNGSSGSSSKPFEQLNSVREALFSQDGWGGNNVKQVSDLFLKLPIFGIPFDLKLLLNAKKGLEKSFLA